MSNKNVYVKLFDSKVVIPVPCKSNISKQRLLDNAFTILLREVMKTDISLTQKG